MSSAIGKVNEFLGGDVLPQPQLGHDFFERFNDTAKPRVGWPEAGGLDPAINQFLCHVRDDLVVALAALCQCSFSSYRLNRVTLTLGPLAYLISKELPV